jgi:uncharacterized protein (DUF1330 family)
MQSSTRLDLMTVYIIAQLKFTQRELYDRYQSRFAEEFRKFRGRLLVADERPEVLERSCERDKVVVLEFPDRTAATEFHGSPEFAEIAADRKADGRTIAARPNRSAPATNQSHRRLGTDTSASLNSFIPRKRVTMPPSTSGVALNRSRSRVIGTRRVVGYGIFDTFFGRSYEF